MYSKKLEMSKAERETYEQQINSYDEKELLYLIYLELKKLNDGGKNNG